MGCQTGKQEDSKTRVTIHGARWFFNNQLINKSSPAEGLLLNVRMVNSVFEDRGVAGNQSLSGFDPAKNTNAFISKIPDYLSSGINAFTISLQGGFPGYEGAVNTAFNPDGSLREEYLERVKRVIRTCDASHAAVILSCFYQRQHSHLFALDGKESIKKALKNVVDWITEEKFTNVLLEVSNEYRHGGYRNWPDGDWLSSNEGQVELIQLARRQNPLLLISTSGMGGGKLDEKLISAADFLLPHFNNTSLNDFSARIKELRKYGKPVVCNEDDKLSQAGAMALSFSVLNGSGWGYMNSAKNQNVPFEFEGIRDDPVVYKMFKNVTTSEYQIDPAIFNQTFVLITSPNDGQVFTVGKNVPIQVSLVNPPDSVPFHVDIMVDNKLFAIANDKFQANWTVGQAGSFILEAIVRTGNGKELYRSPQVDIIAQPEENNPNNNKYNRDD